MSIKKTLIKNSTINIASYLYLLVASLVSIPIILRNLGASTYGAYVIVAGLIPLVSTLDLGLSQATIRYLAHPDTDEKSKTKYWQSSFFLHLVLGASLGILLFALSNLFIPHLQALVSFPHQKLITSLFIISFNVFLNIVIIHFLIYPQATQRFGLYSLRALIVGTGNTLITALVSRYYPDPVIIFTVQSAAYLVTLFVLFFIHQKSFKLKTQPKNHQEQTKKLLSFGIKNFTGRFASAIKSQFSNYIIAAHLSPIAVTAYSIPSKIVTTLAGGISQLTLSFFPLSTSLLQKKYVNRLVRLIFNLEVLIALVGIAQILVIKYFGLTILNWWLGDSQIALMAFPVLRVLSWFFFLTTLTPIPTAVFDALNLPQIPSVAAICAAILDFVLTLYWTPRLGLVGAALASAVTSTIIAPTFLFIFYKYLKLEQKKLNAQ